MEQIILKDHLKHMMDKRVIKSSSQKSSLNNLMAAWDDVDGWWLWILT